MLTNFAARSGSGTENDTLTTKVRLSCATPSRRVASAAAAWRSDSMFTGDSGENIQGSASRRCFLASPIRPGRRRFRLKTGSSFRFNSSDTARTSAGDRNTRTSLRTRGSGSSEMSPLTAPCNSGIEKRSASTVSSPVAV